MNRGKGRTVRRSAEQWREIVSSFEASELTVEVFCSAEGLRRRILRRWQRRFSLPGEAVPARESTGKRFVVLADTPAGAAAWDVALREPQQEHHREPEQRLPRGPNAQGPEPATSRCRRVRGERPGRVMMKGTVPRRPF